jgi:hypothetical protein
MGANDALSELALPVPMFHSSTPHNDFREGDSNSYFGTQHYETARDSSRRFSNYPSESGLGRTTSSEPFKKFSKPPPDFIQGSSGIPRSISPIGSPATSPIAIPRTQSPETMYQSEFPARDHALSVKYKGLSSDLSQHTRRAVHECVRMTMTVSVVRASMVP